MFKVFSFLALFILSPLVYGQSEGFDEALPIEINESKEEISKDPFAAEDPEAIDTEIDSFEGAGADSPAATPQSEPLAIPVEDEVVLLRERVEPAKQSEGNGTADNLVEVRSSRAIFLPYKERQNPWGFTFSFGAEFLYFPNLQSLYPDMATFEDMFGTNSPAAPSIELGPKYNMSWGSLGLTLGYTGLDIKDDRIGAESGIKFDRYSITATYYLDTIWPEAYFVPYIAGGAWQADYVETTDEFPGEKETYTTEVGYHWRAGGLIGLGWLEPKTALRSRRAIGLQEAFLNLYVSSTYMSESEPDPDLESEYDIGATILLEF